MEPGGINTDQIFDYSLWSLMGPGGITTDYLLFHYRSKPGGAWWGLVIHGKALWNYYRCDMSLHISSWRSLMELERACKIATDLKYVSTGLSMVEPGGAW